MQTLKEIRTVVSSKYLFESTEILSILKPFFTVIRSEDLTGPITGVALASIEKFLRHPWITSETIGGKAIMKEIIDAIKQCQFEVTDLQSDEAVLTKVLEVFTTAIECESGILLDDKTIIEIFKCCFKIGRETRPTELLRRSAEAHLQKIIDVVFKRTLNKVVAEPVRLFEHLCELCDPEKEGKSAALRLLGLSLTNSVIEILGSSIQGFPKLLELTINQYTRALLRNSVTTNVLLFGQTIRATINLFYSCAPCIHEQLECFVLCFARIAEAKTSSNEHQELILEMFQELLRDPQFCTYLFIHFDCSESSIDLFDFICKFLSKSAFPVKDGEHLNIRHILSLQALLNILAGICERSHEENKISAEKQVELSNTKAMKQKIFAAIEIFNQTPQKGIKYLQDNGLLPRETDVKDLTLFLKKNSKWLSKAAMAEVLKKEKGLLFEYMKTFDFTGLHIEEALRLLIRNFHLIGSAEAIEGILQAFSNKFFLDNHEKDLLFEDTDAALIFTFSLTMLNSDLHNPRNGVKMSLEQYIKMTQNSINVKTQKMIPRDELERSYNSILVRKFEYENNFKDEFKDNILWENTLKNSLRYQSDFPHQLNEPGHIDCEMFQNIYGKVISATSVILEHSEDPAVLETIRNGFMECSRIASFYKLTSVFDNLVISLCKFTEVLTPSSEGSVVQFGLNNKSQLATKTVFSITRNYGDNLREGWKNILDFILRLYDLSLLPKSILLTEEFAEESKIFANAYEKNRRERKTSNTGFGFFGFFNNNEEDLDAKKSEEKAKFCIEQCHIPELLKDAKILHQPSLEYLVKALIFKSIGFTSGKEDSILSKMFCFDLLTDVSITNKDRAAIIWPYIFDHFKTLLTEINGEYEKSKKLKPERMIVLERIFVSILRLTVRLIHLDDMKSNLNQALLLLLTPNNIHPLLFKQLLPQVCQGLIFLINNSGESIKEVSIWTLIIDTLKGAAASKEIRIKAVEGILAIQVEKHIVWPDNIPAYSHAVILIGTGRVVDILVDLHEKLLIRHESEEKYSQSWCKAWLSILESFGMLSTCTDVEIRHQSLIQLQRIFLDSRVALLPVDLIVSSFHIIIFSLLDQLINSKGVVEIEETRLRGINLLSKTFLNFLTILQQADKLSEIWQEVLIYMKKFSTDSKNGSAISEAIPEHLKNLVLVLNSQNLFKENQKLWDLTKEHLDPSFSDIIKDLTI